MPLLAETRARAQVASSRQRRGGGWMGKMLTASSLHIDTLARDGEGKRCVEERAGRSVSMPSVAPSPLQQRPRLLRLQDRRFRHRFPHLRDALLNYFSCALVSEILLQGHLFVTKNHLAFYSNIFGHKTQIVIAIGDVAKVTKEKIARIIPNAVGVYTHSEKYVFGSMLSRDTAFRVIQQAWKHSSDQGFRVPDDTDSETSPPTRKVADEDSSTSSSVEAGCEGVVSGEGGAPAVPLDPATPTDTPPREPPLKQTPPPHTLRYAKAYLLKIEEIVKELSQLSRTSILFMMSTILLIVLFISTTMLLYRINLLHQKMIIKGDFHFSSIPSLDKIPNFHTSDFTSVVKSLEERIESLAEVRCTLEKLITMASNAQQVPASSFPQHVT